MMDSHAGLDAAGVTLDNLTVRELYKVANRIGIKGDYGRLFKGDIGGGLREAIRARCFLDSAALELLEAAVAEATNKAAPPAPAPAGDVTSAAAALVAALTAQAAQAPVDEMTVRAIVAEALETHQSEPRRLVVHVANHTVEIDGARHAQFERVLKIASTRVDGRRLHVWMTGPSGSGKSYLASQVARAAGLDFYCTGAVASKYDLIGFVSPTGDQASLMTPFRRAFEFGGVFAWDEIDGSDARALVAFNDALANGRYAFPDGMIDAHPDFVALASANTWGHGATAEYVGRTRIDGATLTRFVRVVVDYDEALEIALAGQHSAWARHVQAVRRAVAAQGLKVLVTPRQTLQGAALLETGFNLDEVAAMTVYAGLDDATVARIKAVL